MPAETDAGLRRSPWLFLLGVVVFLGSVGLFLYDLVNGNNAVRGIVANAAAAALVVVLAGLETLSDPESHIQTRGEAVRAMLLFFGLYLVAAGAVVLVVGVLGQPDPRLGAGGVAVGGAIVALMFLTGGTESGIWTRLTTLAGLLGLALVVASVVLFAYDLATGRDVLRGVVVNGVGAAIFILWTAYDMPSDPESGVDTVPDALGVSLLFYGGYLLAAGTVVVLTGLVGHDRGTVGILYLVLATAPLVLGFFLAPIEALTEQADTERPGEDASDTEVSESASDETADEESGG
jgi:hypothetical protein